MNLQTGDISNFDALESIYKKKIGIPYVGITFLNLFNYGTFYLIIIKLEINIYYKLY